VTARAIRVHEHGGPEVLRYEDVPDPSPAPGQALVRVEASGVNFIDVYFRTGLYKPAALPFVAGQEGAGLVEAVGEGAIGVSPGDRVAWTNVPGAYAERAAVPADKLVALPEGLGAREGAAAMLQGTTAHYLATSTYPLKPGDTCVVHAAAGGVGLLLCQVAKRRGAHVIGVVGSADKAALASEAGADHVVVGREAEFEAEARRLTGGRGVQVVYDGVGRATFDASLRSLAPRGMMVLFGQASGPVPPVDPAVLASRGSLFLTRPSLYHYLATREELVARASEVFAWVRDGLLKLRVGAEYPLRDAAAAHRALEGRATTGKVLLIP
jgi:NADPH2:quinone reductase